MHGVHNSFKMAYSVVNISHWVQWVLVKRQSLGLGRWTVKVIISF